jgi:stage V sporulation protein B
MSAIEFILIPRRLISGGLSFHSSLEEYGRLTGMAMPLIFFPALVTSSLATTLVPAISEALSLKNFKSVNHRISKSIQLTFIIGFIFTSIFLAYPNEIGNMLYRKENIGPMLYLLAFSCTFLYLQQTLLGVLNGLGKQSLSLRNSVIGYAIRIGFVYYMVPLSGVNGYVWGIIVSTSIVCVLNLSSVVKTTGMFLDIRNWIIKPGIVGAVMFFTGKYVYAFFEIFNIGLTFTTLLTVLGSIVIGLMLMMVVGVLDKDEVLKLVGYPSSKA